MQSRIVVCYSLGMTTNDKDREPIDPDQLELDDMLLDLSRKDRVAFEALATHERTGEVIDKYGDKIKEIMKKRKK